LSKAYHQNPYARWGEPDTGSGTGMRLQRLRVTLEGGAVDKQHDAGDREQ